MTGDWAQPVEHRWASLAVAAEYVEVTPQTIRRWVAQGLIPAHRIGNTLRVDLNDIDRVAQPVPTVGGEQ